jgi:predicted amidohydrolase
MTAHATVTESTSTSGTFRVALAQIAPVLGDRQRNLDLHLSQIAEARRQNADLIIFPELSLTGYFLRDIVPDVALHRDASELRQLAEAAALAALVVGFAEETPDHLFFNSALFAEAGKILHVHQKVYLPTYGLFEEQRYFARGRRMHAFNSQRFGRVGLLVCEDFWQIASATIMQAEGVDLLICVANSPARGVDGERIRTAETYERLSQTYAQLLGCVVVVCHRVGFEDGLCFYGGSIVVGPDGNLIAEAPTLDESLTIAEVDREELRRARMITPLARDVQLLLTLEELDRIKRERFAEGQALSQNTNPTRQRGTDR